MKSMMVERYVLNIFSGKLQKNLGFQFLICILEI